jgi:multisubunit Na+/H+ antiporter MnhF subunit
MFRFVWRLCGSSRIHKQNSVIAGDTVDTETGQILILKRSVFSITICNYKYLNISLSPVVLSFIHSYTISRNDFLHADGSLFLPSAT